MLKLNCSEIRGFNFQPGYANSSYEAFAFFDYEQIKKELTLGKKYFPKINTIRLWLSFQDWYFDNEKFMQKVESMLCVCDDLGLKVIPCLENRWHNVFCDNGGLYLEHTLKGTKYYVGDKILSYVDDLLEKYRLDERIIIWDACNEPFSYYKSLDEMGQFAIEDAELSVLLCKRIKSHNPIAPVGLSLSGHDYKNAMKKLEPHVDVILIHPYIQAHNDYNEMKRRLDTYYDVIKEYKDYAISVGKQVLVTETCWGSVDPDWRIENMKVNLSVLNSHEIGFLAHALCYSKVADLHDIKGGAIWHDAGQFNFINEDYTLREGHEVFNDYC